MSSSPSVAEQLERARQDLLDLSLRNALLNFRPSRVRGIKVIDEIPREILKILVTDNRPMYFLPAGEDDDLASLEGDLPEELLRLMAESGAESDEPADRHVDNKLQTPYGSARLDVRLRSTFRAATASIQEQGVNILFLALGMLHWFESDSSELERRAPLILIPADLSRTDVRARFRLKHSGEEIGPNLSLEAKLKQDFGIQLPQIAEPESLEVEDYFSGVSHAVSRQKRWSVDERAIHLGFFSFSKLLIYKDLDADAWPEEKPPSAHPIIRALFEKDGFSEPEPLIPENEDLDRHLAVTDTLQVVDSDSSQTLAVVDVKNGRNLVIQGPPGTGKSQTITNLVAEAIAEDKKVLFVAEKMAALEVVKRRLDNVHIGDACLELHSHKANKRAVLDELRRTIHLGKPRIKDPTEDQVLLERQRSRLNEYCQAVNSKIGDSGITAHEAFGEWLRLKRLDPEAEWPTLSSEPFQQWARTDFILRRERVHELQSFVHGVGPPEKHIFWGSGRTALLPMEQSEIRHALSTASKALDELNGSLAELTNLFRIDPADYRDLQDVGRLIEAAERVTQERDLRGLDPRNPNWSAKRDEIESLLNASLQLAELHESYDKFLIPEAWAQNVLALRGPLISYSSKRWRVLSGKYRTARDSLRSLCKSEPPAEGKLQIALVEAILQGQRLGNQIEDNQELMNELFSKRRLGRPKDYRALRETSSWIQQLQKDVAANDVADAVFEMLHAELDSSAVKTTLRKSQSALRRVTASLQEVNDSLELDTEHSNTPLIEQPIDILSQRLVQWQSCLPSLHDIVRFNQHAGRLKELGLNELVDVAASWPKAGQYLSALFETSWISSLIRQAFDAHPVLSQFDGNTHLSVMERFRQLDQDLFQSNRALVALKHWERLPRGQAGGQIGTLRREFEKKRRHLPIRQLIRQAGIAIQRIKPIFMMSPLSIAKFVPPDSVRFDLVVFDEASQVKPVDALGALLRGRQAVVVGDSKQLPPTRFFDRMTEETESEEVALTGDLESILGLFCAQGAPERMLRWHYRSRHESLIIVSNTEFYDNKLVVFPSPDTGRQEVGLNFLYRPDTVYEKGTGRRYNVGEAKAVAAAVMEHAGSAQQHTLGVAAFSLTQAHRIEDELEILRRQDSSNESFFSSHPGEPFFIKNLENVQGDERDVIYISVGYGKSEGGLMTINFGPLNKDGGERRLNVLITRARRRCVVFSNFTADDLDPRRTQARGVISLKRFLKYAQTGSLDLPRASNRDPGSPFEEEVEEQLVQHGFEVDHQVGSAGFFIDLAVVDQDRPGRYLLGIECDGATYHSARSARDRDRLRQQVLEGLGWKIHRIWSTDWFNNPKRELEKVLASIEDAQLRGRSPEHIGTIKSADPPLERIDAKAPEITVHAEPYRIADVRLSLGDLELHEVPLGIIADHIVEVVKVESPVHLLEVARRVANGAGLKRVGTRIREHVERGADQAVDQKEIVRWGDFLWLPDTQSMILRDRSHAPHSLRRIETVAAQEIGEALIQCARAAHGIKEEGGISEACRLLGFRRVGPDIHERVRKILSRLVTDGFVEVRAGFLHSTGATLRLPTLEGRDIRSSQGEKRSTTQKSADDASKHIAPDRRSLAQMDFLRDVDSRWVSYLQSFLNLGPPERQQTLQRLSSSQREYLDRLLEKLRAHGHSL